MGEISGGVEINGAGGSGGVEVHYSGLSLGLGLGFKSVF